MINTTSTCRDVPPHNGSRGALGSNSNKVRAGSSHFGAEFGDIRKIDSAGVVTTLAGAKERFGVVWSPLPASLGLMQAVAVTVDGNLVITSENAVLDVRF